MSKPEIIVSDSQVQHKMTDIVEETACTMPDKSGWLGYCRREDFGRIVYGSREQAAVGMIGPGLRKSCWRLTNDRSSRAQTYLVFLFTTAKPPGLYTYCTSQKSG